MRTARWLTEGGCYPGDAVQGMLSGGGEVAVPGGGNAGGESCL